MERANKEVNLASHSRVSPLLTLWAATLPLSPPQTGATALHWAATVGHLRLIEQLLAEGADTEAKNNRVLSSPPGPLLCGPSQRRVC
jgi:ankyrin repeat protein